MKVSRLPLLQTGYFGGLTGAYLQQSPALSPFYNLPFSISNFEKAIAAKEKEPLQREDLYQVLLAQHSPYFATYPLIAEMVELIKRKNTFTVTTGHQLCMATGPLYLIYKIASTIHLCNKLKAQYSNYTFIPVFWMASEDHDFDEINHIHIFNKKIDWDTQIKGATGRISTKDTIHFIEQLKEIIGNNLSDLDLFSLIEEAYKNHNTLSEATRDLVINLFSGELLVLDADDKTLKNNFKQIIKTDLLQKQSFQEVGKSIQALLSAGLIKEDKVQVKPREINFFYMKDSLRKRIVFENSLYKVLDTEITFDETMLLQEIEQFPERFSPNVLMRPVYQEFILPNLCYIGGAGELSYWFELKSTFDAFGISFPILALRKSFLWIDKKQSDKLNAFQISTEDLFKPIDQLIEKVLTQLGVDAIDFSEEKKRAADVFDILNNKITLIDPTLKASVSVELQKLIKSIEMLESKASKAQKNKHEITINQVKKIKENIFPEGGLQERYENILWLNLKYGKGLINQIIAMADIEIPDLTVVWLEGMETSTI